MKRVSAPRLCGLIKTHTDQHDNAEGFRLLSEVVAEVVANLPRLMELNGLTAQSRIKPRETEKIK